MKKGYHIIQKYVSETVICELKPPVLNNTCSGLPFLGYLLLLYQVKLSKKVYSRLQSRQADSKGSEARFIFFNSCSQYAGMGIRHVGEISPIEFNGTAFFQCLDNDLSMVCRAEKKIDSLVVQYDNTEQAFTRT